MWSNQVMFTVLAASTLSSLVKAVPSNLKDRGVVVSACSVGIFKELSHLKDNPFAVLWCQSAYPPEYRDTNLVKKDLPLLTVTIPGPTLTLQVSVFPATASNPETPSSVPTEPSTTPQAEHWSDIPALPSAEPEATPTSAADEAASIDQASLTEWTEASPTGWTDVDDPQSLWHKFKTQDRSIIATVCSCIQDHPPCQPTATANIKVSTTMSVTESVVTSTTASFTMSTTPLPPTGLPHIINGTTCPTPVEHYCNEYCFCGVQVASHRAFCYDSFWCPKDFKNTCKTNDDCKGTDHPTCVFDEYHFCGGGTVCAGSWSCPGDAANVNYTLTTSTIRTGPPIPPTPVGPPPLPTACSYENAAYCHIQLNCGVVVEDRTQAICYQAFAQDLNNRFTCKSNADCAEFDEKVCVFADGELVARTVCALPAA